ncbi:hypothetical protein [Zobellia galactanivorans]|uniref:hypothetical protein n=1 Tax=Zobellia galactanivorans (strain DSM 12802 / CCUG 47099 / CIP 106680 / NCIMB 13871 / Dsij) TaxID=63186 RepID=UPI001C075882|nr:hypothetical protein [Zobellia galactanivorans]MBU3025713.1 hypothetical protein [Zobellia galactanivorans]
MPHTTKILKTPLRISIAVLLLGMLSRIFHWPHAPKAILVAFIAILVLYGIRFYRKHTKEFIDYVKLVMVVSWTLNGIFRVLDLPFTLLFQILIAISFITWFIMEGTAYFLDEDRRAKNSMARVIWNFAMVIGALAIIVGSLLNILNETYAIPLMAVGIAIIVAYILKDVFAAGKNEKEDQSNEEYQL